MEKFLTDNLIKVILYQYQVCELFFLFIFLLKDSYFTVWTGCYACPCNENALLCCVAINGYHPRVSYQWSSNDGRVSIGGTPLIYCDKLGTYKCLVKLGEQEQQVEKEFRVLS